MTEARAYLAVLGVTGLVTASVVVLLVIGSGFAAFDGPPDTDGTTDPLERIVVEENAEEALDSAPTRSAAGGRADGSSPLAAADRRPLVSRKGVVRAGARGVGARLGGGAVAPTGGTGGGAAAGGGPVGGGNAGGAPDRGPSAGGPQYGGGSPMPPPVRNTVGGAVEGATGVVGGAVDGVGPGVDPPVPR